MLEVTISSCSKRACFRGLQDLEQKMEGSLRGRLIFSPPLHKSSRYKCTPFESACGWVYREARQQSEAFTLFLKIPWAEKSLDFGKQNQRLRIRHKCSACLKWKAHLRCGGILSFSKKRRSCEERKAYILLYLLHGLLYANPQSTLLCRHLTRLPSLHQHCWDKTTRVYVRRRPNYSLP